MTLPPLVLPVWPGLEEVAKDIALLMNKVEFTDKQLADMMELQRHVVSSGMPSCDTQHGCM